MNFKSLILFIFTIYLGSSVALASYSNTISMNVPDTITEKITQEEVIVRDTAFGDLERELNELNENTKIADTTKIRVGKLKISVIDDGEDVIITREKDKDTDWDDWEDRDDYWDNDSDNDFSVGSINKKFKPHWAGFYMGLNNYMTSDFSTTLPEDSEYLAVNTNKSYEVIINFAELGIPIIKHRIGLVTGIGFKWNNYKFKNTQVRLIPDSSYLTYEIDTINNNSKSKLTVSYLTVPLLLEFQIPVQDNPLFISAGVEGSIKLGSHTKMKTNDGKKSKDKSDFHVSPYTLAVTARIGYDWFGIYGSYSLQKLFQGDESPELYPFAIGIGIVF